VIDTPGPVVGVAVFRRDASEPLWADAERVIAGADGWVGLALAEALGRVPNGAPLRVGVAVGPGAFTGLRVGLAAALGLAFARNVGIVPLCSLALRASLAPGHGAVLAVLDAKKGRVYAGLFSTLGDVPVPLVPPSDLEPATLADWAGPALFSGMLPVVVGEGAGVLADRLLALGWTPAHDAGRSPVFTAAALLFGSDPRDPALVAPVYLREPDASPPAGVRPGSAGSP
jgi:tRNA threonylcarbamoyladenosine biosynthesis protein TsaB